MAVTTVRQLLTDAATALVALEADTALSVAERNMCATCDTTITAVLGDLNAQNVIPNPGRRNATVTNLHDQCLVPIVAIDQAHIGSGGKETAIYNAVDRIADARQLIAAQQSSDDVTY